jgi:hypothetical protein
LKHSGTAIGERRDMGSRPARVARALTAAAFATFVAAFSHVVSGGGAPGFAGLALSLAFSSMACVALAGRRFSFTRISISVLISQFAFHMLFEVGGSASSLLSSGLHDGMGGMAGMDGMAQSSSAAGMTMTVDSSGAFASGAASSAHLGHNTPGMWVAHGIAAVITIAAFRWGEQTLRRLVELTRLRFRALVRLPFVQPVPGRALLRADPRPVADGLRDLGVLLGTMRHRGPPVGFAAPV